MYEEINQLNKLYVPFMENRRIEKKSIKIFAFDSVLNVLYFVLNRLCNSGKRMSIGNYEKLRFALFFTQRQAKRKKGYYSMITMPMDIGAQGACVPQQQRSVQADSWAGEALPLLQTQRHTHLLGECMHVYGCVCVTFGVMDMSVLTEQQKPQPQKQRQERGRGSE